MTPRQKLRMNRNRNNRPSVNHLIEMYDFAEYMKNDLLEQIKEAKDSEKAAVEKAKKEDKEKAEKNAGAAFRNLMFMVVWGLLSGFFVWYLVLSRFLP